MTMTAPKGDDTAADPAVTAERLAALGWMVHPITPGRKHPPLRDWRNTATDDLDTIRAWWSGPYAGHGVGVACGPRSGLWVLDVDVSDGKQGRESLDALIAEHGPLPATVVVDTGSGGRHIYFAWDPDRPVTNGMATRLPPGLDIRGDGGQVVAPPTVHPDGGLYQWRRDPWTVDIAPAPDWLYDLLTTPDEPPVAPVIPLPSRNGAAPLDPGDDSIAAWVRERRDWHTELTRQGWHSPRAHGSDTAWTRPGKQARDGHSAILHEPDGPLVIWTTEIPPGLEQAGSPTTDGSGISVSMFGFVAAYEHGGDRSAAARAARAERTATERPGPVGPIVLDGRTPAAPIVVSPNLPAEFWDARSRLAHIRDAAWSRLRSPDAVFGALLARLSAFTSPTHALPALQGSPSSLSMYTAVTGPSGAGKTTSKNVAAEILPVDLLPPGSRDKVAINGLGSGEGLLELYMGEQDSGEVDSKGKAITERAKVRNGALVSLDEGAALAEMGGRKGATMLPTLRSMWTGDGVGTANASAVTTRKLAAQSYTLGLVLGIQPTLAAELLSDDAAGTPQRFLWVSALDPSIPDECDWPGVLPWRHPSASGGLDVAGSIRAEIRAQALAVTRGEILLDPLDSHRELLRLKVAGLLAVLDTRTDVSVEDWELAGVVLTTSIRVRESVTEAVRAEIEERERRADRQAARRAVATDQARARQEEERYAEVLAIAAGAVARKVWRDGEISRRQATQAITGKHRKVLGPEAVDQAVDHAIEAGWLVEIGDGRYQPGAVQPS